MGVEQIKLGKWTAYNLAQTKEGHLFMQLLYELVNQVKFESKIRRGRPDFNIPEMLFCCGLKLYTKMPSRSLTSQLEFAKERGYIQKVPHFNTVLKYLRDERLTSILKELLTISSLPLRDVETKFAVDATGFSTRQYAQYSNRAYKEMSVKAHAMCGVFTNIITSLEITKKYSHESLEFPKLVRKTAEHFKPKEISADMGYSSKNNLKIVDQLGAIPYIPFKSNISPRLRKGRGSIWSGMYFYFHEHKEEFNEHYHLRSNIESVFSAIKRKFGSKLFSKDFVAQTNELYLKYICYNIAVLIKSLFKLNISIDLNKCAETIPAHKLTI